MRLLLAALLLALAACADAPPEAGTTAAVPTSAPAARAATTAEAAAGTALAVGDAAPGFALPDAMGRETRLSDLLARGPVVLTFYRGSWCPYCNTQLRDYQLALPDIEAAGASLVAVSPQTPDSTMTIVERQSLAFPVLSDVGNAVSRAYGLVFAVDAGTREQYRAVGIDLAASNGTDTWELPVPATYVVAPDGTVRFAFVEADYTRRATPAQIVEALETL
jgi:peroxiredoxin